MYIHFLSSRQPESSRRALAKRKGGGGRGGGGGGRGGGGGKGGDDGGESAGGSGSGARSPTSVSGTASKSGTATSYGSGGGRAITIPNGSPFAGRTAGGGTRAQTFGGRRYGSGYPGLGNNGVAGRGFPFYFWPVVWGSAIGAGGAHYLDGSEYGNESNSSRPGGPMVESTLTSVSGNSTFHLLADNATVIALLSSIGTNCSADISGGNGTAPIAFNASAEGAPRPEQAVQYYRASSVVLTLDGYNDTAALTDNNATADVPLPAWVNDTLLNCLNQTIGAAVPLINSAPSSLSPSTGLNAVVLFWILWIILIIK